MMMTMMFFSDNHKYVVTTSKVKKGLKFQNEYNFIFIF